MQHFRCQRDWLLAVVLLTAMVPVGAIAGVDSQDQVTELGLDLGGAHKYLGYSTLAVGGLAALTGADQGGHKALGMGTAVLGAATLITGLIEHLEWFDLGDGLDDHDVHIILGSLAAVGFMGTAALGASDEISHAGLGSAAVVTLGLSVALLRW